ncbi:AP-1 mu protein [Pyrenophora tritici-repentis]|nr:AP-1 mu protein [Pyrenophora tritici-repentis]
MASAIFFLDLKGKTLLARNYRGDIPMSAVEKFPILLSEAEDESSAVPPCFSSEGINYLYIRHNNLYLLALTKRNTNAAEILLFLHKIVEVFTEYFKELEEESIRDNFVVIYELLDEMMDFGYPQTTETKILQEFDYPSLFLYYVMLTGVCADTSHKSRISSKSHGRPSQSQTPSAGAARESDTARTKFSSTSSNRSTS